jgi:hypothetical protein
VRTIEGHADDNIRHEWRFRIGDALPSDSPLARFIVAVGGALNDNLLSNTRFVESDKPYEHIYFFNLASSHLYEAAETFRQAHREWNEVRDFIAALDEESRNEFERITDLAAPDADWPGNRLKEIRNSFFHYIRLDRAASDAGRLPLAHGLEAAADVEGLLVIEPGAPLGGIRALFADEVAIKTLTEDYDDDELRRLVAALANYQADLNRFAQMALGRYLREQPDGVVTHEEREVGGGGRDVADGV